MQLKSSSHAIFGLILISFTTLALAQKEKEEFQCPSTIGNGNYADPATCRRFYQCVDGFPYLNRCPSGLYFDDLQKFCTFKDEAKCGPLSTTPSPITDAPADTAQKCNTEECRLPYCFCSKDGTQIPGGLEAEQIPQIIMLTFDGAVNLNNYDHYQKIFNGKRKNPNGCNIRGTFFMSHEYSNYQQIQHLGFAGHEIATESISQQQGLQDKGYEEWVGEMIGMREILRHFSNVSVNDVVGMRAPFLKPGRNTQYKVLEDFGYIYDSSITVPPVNVPVWPYTLDYKISHECKSGTCPSKTFPGVWEVPLNTHYVEGYEGGHCPYLDQCVLHNLDENEVFEWLQEDFTRYYEQNKAPYMMPFHTNWFQTKPLENGLHKFLDWALELPDVYVLTITQMLQYMTDPKETRDVNTIESWKCDKSVAVAPKPCNNWNTCALPFKIPEQNITDTRYMETCRECPNVYPWLGDASGTGIQGRDNYIFSGPVVDAEEEESSN
ncbi:chitin deacetylase 1 [Teleopsis dalmanni]|uniref:chitin deacetylase 1 n=1 Tax=Teleopsis dalmanni TaxID=139649 RepID=UPI0018CC915B|nr:chitin deacetylase 1 [Teleopsis dalmanni]